MHTRIAIAALLALGCGTPEDAFVGRYAGSYECSGSFEDGTPYAEGPADQTIRIDRDLDGRLFMAGASCTIPLDLVSISRAEIERSGCDVFLPSGLEVVVIYRNGAFMHNEPQMGYRLDVMVAYPEDILMAVCNFSGTRIE